MASWAAQQAIRSIVFVAIVGGALYGLYRFIDQQGRQEGDLTRNDDCRADRREILEVCEPMCEASADSPMPVQVMKHGQVESDCLAKCSMKRFERPLPLCESRR